MTWTRAQRVCFMRACAQAELTDPMRYILMRHAGCPLKGSPPRPSISHAANDNGMFERCMAIVERHAAGLGHEVRPPKGQRSWAQSAANSGKRMVHKIRAIAAECVERIPEVFDEGFLAGFISRMTKHDEYSVTLRTHAPGSLEECDEGQLYRILEGLRAWGGREFARRGVHPRSFVVPRHITSEITRKHGAAA